MIAFGEIKNRDKTSKENQQMKDKDYRIIAIIPAGGRGTRLGSPLPKQYLKVNGKEIIAYTLEVFQNSDLIDEIIVAAEKSFFPLLNELKEKYGLTKVSRIVEGGATRQDSVNNALLAIENVKPKDLIVVHDAARPNLKQETLEKAVTFAREKGNAVVASKVSDTLLQGDSTVQDYLDREKVFAVQTPQIFPYEQIRSAMDKAIKENFTGTDESSLVFRASYKVNIFEGNPDNFKITSETDLTLFEFFLKLKTK